MARGLPIYFEEKANKMPSAFKPRTLLAHDKWNFQCNGLKVEVLHKKDPNDVCICDSKIIVNSSSAVPATNSHAFLLIIHCPTLRNER